MNNSHISIIILLTIFSACHTGEVKKKEVPRVVKDSTNFTEIKWIDSVKYIGAVEGGKKTEIEFRFKNTGTKPLFIISAEPGCGCTIADYPKGAIAPGAEGLIKAAYDIKEGTQGEFRKNIHVTTNTKGSTSHYVFFYGIIEKTGDQIPNSEPDTAKLNAIATKELERHFLIKPTKN